MDTVLSKQNTTTIRCDSISIENEHKVSLQLITSEYRKVFALIGYPGLTVSGKTNARMRPVDNLSEQTEIGRRGKL